MEKTNVETPENTSVALKEEVASIDLVKTLKEPDNNFYCSIVDEGDRKSKIAIYNAINSVDERVSNHIGEVIECVNIVAHPVQLVDDQTGEVVIALRTVLIDKNGKSYGAVSQGIASSLQKIFSIVGMPDGGAWEKEPVKMKFRQVQTRNNVNKVTTLELV